MVHRLAAFAACVAATTSILLPASVRGQPDDPKYELSVERMRDEVYNPWTREMDTVELRTFKSVDRPGAIAPPLRASPGETMKLRVNNQLAECTPEELEEDECYNSVNIHTHGLWISPSGNSDNVLLAISPGTQFDYEFVIADDHPAGTFWYHPHMHGSTSIQLGSGMAGALIIDGDRVPTRDSYGDIDVLFSEQDGTAFGETIMVFSQIQYGCRDAEGAIKAPRSEDPETPPWEQPAWVCDAEDIGTVDRWDQFGSWENNAGRMTSINREVLPTLDGFQTGGFQRLRMIHAGLRLPVKMSIRRLADGAPALRDVPADQHRAYIDEYCTGETIGQYHFADDGLTRRAMRRVEQTSMFPGSRLDALVYFDEPGLYCMVDDQRWRMQPDRYQMLGMLEVAGDSSPVADAGTHLVATLSAAAAQVIEDETMRAKVIGELADGMKLSAFSWHETVADEEITGHRKAQLTIEEHDDGSESFSINGTPHQHGRIDEVLTLGDVEEWELTSPLGRHPFHIHVNPFQVISIRNREGKDVTIEGTEAYDPDYAGMIGGWRDTLIVKMLHTITIRTRYQRYIGDFVMHCHFASHGDQGMMQNVRIQPAGSQHTHNKGERHPEGEEAEE